MYKCKDNEKKIESTISIVSRDCSITHDCDAPRLLPWAMWYYFLVGNFFSMSYSHLPDAWFFIYACIRADGTQTAITWWTQCTCSKYAYIDFSVSNENWQDYQYIKNQAFRYSDVLQVYFLIIVGDPYVSVSKRAFAQTLQMSVRMVSWHSSILKKMSSCSGFLSDSGLHFQLVCVIDRHYLLCLGSISDMSVE